LPNATGEDTFARRVIEDLLMRIAGLPAFGPAYAAERTRAILQP
jgi:hypothetical protein